MQVPGLGKEAACQGCPLGIGPLGDIRKQELKGNETGLVWGEVGKLGVSVSIPESPSLFAGIGGGAL